MKKRQYPPIFYLLGLLLLISLSWSCKEGEPAQKQAQLPAKKISDTIGVTSEKPIMTKPEKAVTKKPEKPKITTVQQDSIYPKEYSKGDGLEQYKKLMRGVYLYEKNYSGRDWDLELSRVDFFDTLGQKIKAFDIRAAHPYTKATIPSLERGNYESYIYDSFVPKSESAGKAAYAPDKYFTRAQSSLKGLPVIGYHLLGMKDNKIVDWKFTAICMDERGRVLRTFKDLDIDPYRFCLSENKEFFCVAYGGLRGENLTRLRNNGFRIYEIATGDLVYEINVDDRHSISGPSPDNLVQGIFYGSFGIKGNDFSNNRDKTYNKINFNTREVFSRNFSYDQKEMIKRSDREGFLMQNPKTKKRWKLYYVKDFDIEKF